MSSPVEAGQMAPPVELRTSEGEEFSLRSLEGRAVVLFFFPKASTPG